MGQPPNQDLFCSAEADKPCSTVVPKPLLTSQGIPGNLTGIGILDKHGHFFSVLWLQQAWGNQVTWMTVQQACLSFHLSRCDDVTLEKINWEVRKCRYWTTWCLPQSGFPLGAVLAAWFWFPLLSSRLFTSFVSTTSGALCMAVSLWGHYLGNLCYPFDTFHQRQIWGAWIEFLVTICLCCEYFWPCLQLAPGSFCF